MTSTLAGYPDLLGGTLMPSASSKEKRAAQRLNRVNKQIKKIKKQLAELRAQQALEVARIAEERRTAAEKEQRDGPFFRKIKNAFVNAIPMALTAIGKFITKGLFSRIFK